MLQKKSLNYIQKKEGASTSHLFSMVLSRVRRSEPMTSFPYSYSALYKLSSNGHVLYVSLLQYCILNHLSNLTLNTVGELLQTMCDPLKLNGETGYYLATFHAAMTHINELDLTEANDELSIFMDLLPG
jgi:hypothetical protein